MTFTCKCGAKFRYWPQMVEHLALMNPDYPRRQNRKGDEHGPLKADIETLEQFLARQDSQGHAR